MHVLKVELENIKSYAHALFEFSKGTTAITGANGAGKTTLLEAIAWTLFDVLDYSKDDFLRRGAKKGAVRVVFETSPEVDGRQYLVYRDTANGYYLLDLATNTRIAEKKADVQGMLRKLFGFDEPGTDLRALFRSAIGVPQGAFTADFLLASNPRKAAFDRLLKVEEYREGADRLRATVNLINERTAFARERIAKAEGQLINYDAFVREQEILSANIKTLDANLLELRAQIAAGERQVAEFETSFVALNAAQMRAAQTESAARSTQSAHAAAARELDAAKAAAAQQQAHAAAHEHHLAALEELKRLEAQSAARDTARAAATQAERALTQAQNELARATEAHARAMQAGTDAATLDKDVKRQAELENEREKTIEQRASARSAQQRFDVLEKELDDFRKQYRKIDEQVKQAGSFAGAPARVEQLQSERLEAENNLGAARESLAARRQLNAQQKQSDAEIKRLRGEVAAHTRELEMLTTAAAAAAGLPALETETSELNQRLAQVKAEIARDEKFSREVKNGLCPILSERCLNLKAGETLADYFSDQFALNRGQITTLEEQIARANQQLETARVARAAVATRATVAAQHARNVEQLNERERDAQDLANQLAQLPAYNKTDEETFGARLGAIDAELIAARDAALRHAELKPLQAQLKELTAEGKRKREEHDALKKTVAELESLEQNIARAEAELKNLNDPRGRAAALRAEHTRADEFAKTVAAQDATVKELTAQTENAARALAEFAALDTQIAAARDTRETTLGAHRAYLAHGAQAALLPRRQTELAVAETEMTVAQHAFETARNEVENATKLYDRAAHDAARMSLIQQRERAATLAAQLANAEQRAAEIAAEIEKLNAVRHEMRGEFAEKGRLEKIAETTEFIRDTLKQAAPLVTESYLFNISQDANQLFREITGEAARTLRWTRDYEITLEEDGHERSFPNLSGGEQMVAALSVRLALLKQLSDIRLAFFDEPTVNMDSERRTRLAQQIGEITDFDQLFVISHDDTFEENVDSIVRVPEDGTKAVVNG